MRREPPACPRHSRASGMQKGMPAVMCELARGPLAPTAILWIFLGAPLDHGDLAARLKMSERLARYFPSNAVIVRRAVFLAYDGQTDEAHHLFVQTMRTFRHRCEESISILQQALTADPAAV